MFGIQRPALIVFRGTRFDRSGERAVISARNGEGQDCGRTNLAADGQVEEEESVCMHQLDHRFGSRNGGSAAQWPCRFQQSHERFAKSG